MMRAVLLAVVVMVALAGCGTKPSRDPAKIGVGKTKEEREKFGKTHNQQGIEACQQADYNAAIMAFQYAIKNEEKSEYYNNLGRAMHLGQHYELAIGSYEKAVKLGKPTADLYANMADSFLELKQNVRAEELYHQALTLQPEMARAHFGLGDMYLKAGNFRDAEYRLNKALELSPDNGRTMLSKAILLHMTKRNPEAWQIIETLERRGFAVKEDFKQEVLDALGGMKR